MKPRSALFLGLGLLTATGVWAAGRIPARMVSDRPCQDGWNGCFVDGELVNAEPVFDQDGRLQPVDLRVGFFDLKATRSFSVHNGLSTYGADDVPQIPERVVSEPVPPSEPDIESDSEVADQDAVAQVDPVPQANTEWNDPLYENPGAQSRVSKPNLGNEKASVNTKSTREPTPREPTPREPTPREPTPREPTPREPSSVEPSPAAVSVHCDDLRQLEGVALLGALSPAHSACMEHRIETESSQTTKNKISRVLLINAETSKNGEWPRLMKRHLTEINQSDPDMCLKYALHLSRRKGASSSHGVIKWSELALERKSQWSGPTFTKRVYDLHKLRAHAANKLWQRTNEDLLNAGSNREALAGKEEKSRGRAKGLAREWLDFARAASQNTSEAMSLCISTAGSKKFCKE
jgi:hypothetical protein